MHRRWMAGLLLLLLAACAAPTATPPAAQPEAAQPTAGTLPVVTVYMSPT